MEEVLAGSNHRAFIGALLPRVKAAELYHLGPARGCTHDDPTHHPRDDAIGVGTWHRREVHA